MNIKTEYFNNAHGEIGFIRISTEPAIDLLYYSASIRIFTYADEKSQKVKTAEYNSSKVIFEGNSPMRMFCIVPFPRGKLIEVEVEIISKVAIGKITNIKVEATSF